MPAQNSLDLAKQGNPRAISELINHSLKSQGILAKVSKKDDCLRILLESEKVPDQKDSTTFIYNGIVKLGVVGIHTLQIFGQQIGDDMPTWNQSTRLSSATPRASATEQAENREQHSNISTPAKVVNATFKERLQASGLLLFMAVGVLIIPFIGWIISPILLLIAAGAMLQGPQHKGNCPYCSSEVTAALQAPGVDCPACKKRILIKEERFWKTD